jgi:hypothetical protein
MLGKGAIADDPLMKIRSLNRILVGWANYYRMVNAHQQYITMDYVAKQLLIAWHMCKYKCGKLESVRELCKRERIVFEKGDSSEELFRMRTLQSQYTAMNHRAIWKYRHIENPYLKGTHVTDIPNEEQALIDAREIHPIAVEYDEVYQANRLLALDRDGWHCKCGEWIDVETHHIKPVPKGPFDPYVVHAVTNLVTMCTKCHGKTKRKRHPA